MVKLFKLEALLLSLSLKEQLFFLFPQEDCLKQTNVVLLPPVSQAVQSAENWDLRVRLRIPVDLGASSREPPSRERRSFCINRTGLLAFRCGPSTSWWGSSRDLPDVWRASPEERNQDKLTRQNLEMTSKNALQECPHFFTTPQVGKICVSWLSIPYLALFFGFSGLLLPPLPLEDLVHNLTK